MFGINFNRQRAGIPIAARTINRPSEQSQKDARIRVGPGLAQTNVGGIPLIRKVEPVEYDVRITAVGTGGNAGRYSWQAVFPDPDTPGAWLDRDAKLSGTIADDPLYEFNLNATLTVGMRVRASRILNELRCLYGRCT